MTDFDAAAAAAKATGDTPPSPDESSSESDQVASDHADAEGAPDESDMGNTSRWRQMLQSGDPNPPLHKVESPWNPTEGGPTRVMRAVKKMAGMNNLPAWADLAIAIPETWVWIQENHLDNVGQSGDDDQEESGEGRGEVL